MGQEDYNNIRETHLIVAALIATVTFTAGLSLPGGYHSNEGPGQGTALLARVATFKVFVITNAFAMGLSSSAIVVYLESSLVEVRRKLKKLFASGVGLLQFAMTAMKIAFVSGSCAVLSNSLDLAVGVLIVIGSCCVILNRVRPAGTAETVTKTFLDWVTGGK